MCSLLDHLQEAVWLIDEASLHIVYANTAAARLLGVDVAAMQGLSVLSIVSTPQDIAFWADASGAMAMGQSTHTSVLHSNGNLVPVCQCVTRIASEVFVPGYRTVFMLTMLDMTTQRVTEREMETLLSELRATLDSAADGMLVCSLDGAIRAFNQQLVQLWDLPRSLLLERNDAAVYAFMAAQVVDAEIYKTRIAFLGRDRVEQSIDLLTLRTGAVIEMRSVPQFSHGRPAGRVYSYRDVTRQTETQASLRLAARVFESSLDAIFIADDQHRVLRMNPVCEQLVGTCGSALQGRMAACLFDQNSAAALMEQVLQAWALQGFWDGELVLPREHGGHSPVQLSWVALHDDEGHLVQSIGFMRDLTGQQAAQKRIEQLAYTDVLTGLPNRLLLAQRVDAALQEKRQGDAGFAILFLDLDRFKIINDSLGHSFGDRILQLVAERLQACLRSTDLLCRLGGDEFVIYLHSADVVVAENVSRRILSDMLQPFSLDAMGFSVQCSIGIALYPQDGVTLDDLIKQSDTAMYRVKERGRGSFSFYQPQMNANMLARMQMEHAMRQALGLQRMAVHYQPQVNIATGRITGAEALLRWNDPERGPVSPGVFIPLAEESGYIVTLGAWVMEQAVREAAAWMYSGLPIVISVNVSALEFRQTDFVDRVTRMLAVHQLPPTLLELELTESILLHDAQEMEQRLHQLAELGVGLAIDDFGTGYSSLAYLKNLPIHKLKIDQSFVGGLATDDGDRAIVNAIISMGRAMHVEVVAEGVETETQRAVLQQMQCDHYQGFLCAPALAPVDFMTLLRASGRSTLSGSGAVQEAPRAPSVS